jgi:hypothetical protein
MKFEAGQLFKHAAHRGFLRQCPWLGRVARNTRQVHRTKKLHTQYWRGFSAKNAWKCPWILRPVFLRQGVQTYFYA